MFAGTTFVLSLINLQTAKVATPNIVVGMAVFVGGLVQLLAGMWEFAAGNTFGATAFSGYGAFWLSYALILIPGTGILTSYGDNADELAKAISFFLFSWFIFTFLMLCVPLPLRLAPCAADFGH
jgi:succinate-acetate transporter protein